MNIKIQWKGKIHLLSKSITTIDGIYTNIKERYPNDFKNDISLYLEQNGQRIFIESYEDLEKLNSNNGTVKLKVCNNEMPRKQQSSTQKFEEIIIPTDNSIRVPHILQQNMGKQYDSRKNKFSNPINESESINPIQKQQNFDTYQKNQMKEGDNNNNKQQILGNDDDDNQIPKSNMKKIAAGQQLKKYPCYSCGINPEKEQKQMKKCKICQGKSQISQNHPVIPFLTQIINDRLKLIKYKIEQQLNYMEQQYDTQFQYKFIDTPVSKIRCPIGKEYQWTIRLQNSGKQDWPQKVFIFKNKNNRFVKIFQLESVRKKEQINITFNFRADNITPKYQNNEFVFGYYDANNDLVQLGRQFGYQLQIKNFDRSIKQHE